MFVVLAVGCGEAELAQLGQVCAKWLYLSEGRAVERPGVGSMPGRLAGWRDGEAPIGRRS